MTLTEVSKIFRKGVVIFGVVAVMYYVFILLLKPTAKNLYLAIFPPKDPPTPIYGMLPPLEFVEKKTKNTTPPTFNLDTKDGRLPRDIPKKLTVYKYLKPRASFEKGKDAIQTAAALGYTDEDLTSNLKETVYKWQKLASNGVLEINTDTREIKLVTPLDGKSEKFVRGSISETTAKEYATDILTNIGRLQGPLYQSGSQTVTLGYYVGKSVRKTDNPTDANRCILKY